MGQDDEGKIKLDAAAKRQTEYIARKTENQASERAEEESGEKASEVATGVCDTQADLTSPAGGEEAPDARQEAQMEVDTATATPVPDTPKKQREVTNKHKKENRKRHEETDKKQQDGKKRK